MKKLSREEALIFILEQIAENVLELSEQGESGVLEISVEKLVQEGTTEFNLSQELYAYRKPVDPVTEELNLRGEQMLRDLFGDDE